MNRIKLFISLYYVLKKCIPNPIPKPNAILLKIYISVMPNMVNNTVPNNINNIVLIIGG